MFGSEGLNSQNDALRTSNIALFCSWSNKLVVICRRLPDVCLLCLASAKFMAVRNNLMKATGLIVIVWWILCKRNFFLSWKRQHDCTYRHWHTMRVIKCVFYSVISVSGIFNLQESLYFMRYLFYCPVTKMFTRTQPRARTHAHAHTPRFLLKTTASFDECRLFSNVN